MSDLSRRLFLASGPAAAVFGSLKLAIAKPTFDPKAYIAAWRSTGARIHSMGLAGGRRGISLEFDKGLSSGGMRVAEFFWPQIEADPNWQSKVIAELDAEEERELLNN